MTLLILGLLVWSGVHFIPSFAQPLKHRWKKALGDVGYQGTFSLIVALSLTMIVFGWRSATPSLLYASSEIFEPIAIILMIAAFILFGASRQKTRIKQFIRHPQLTGVLVWSFAHLLINGDSRSIVLFGSIGVWAVLQIFAINHRDGKWIKTDIPPWPMEIKGVAISLAIFLIAALLHPYIAGVPVK